MHKKRDTVWYVSNLCVTFWNTVEICESYEQCILSDKWRPFCKVCAARIIPGYFLANLHKGEKKS